MTAFRLSWAQLWHLSLGLQIVRKTVGELVYYTVGYMQMTEEQVLVPSSLSGLAVSFYFNLYTFLEVFSMITRETILIYV